MFWTVSEGFYGIIEKLLVSKTLDKINKNSKEVFRNIVEDMRDKINYDRTKEMIEFLDMKDLI